jgi:uncharacterized iron-regulated membrane protein
MDMGGMDMSHIGHDMGDMAGMATTNGSGDAAVPDASRYAALDRLVPVVAALELSPPVLIAPPSRANAQWTARSDTQNRPRRVNLTLDADAAQITARKGFGDKPLLDRVIGVGVAAHEGQLFGWFNQLLGVLTALGLITLSISALTMWWKRRPAGLLGAPAPVSTADGKSGVPAAFVVLAVLFGLLLPLMGATLIAVLLAERLLLRRLPRARQFLGLAA